MQVLKGDHSFHPYDHFGYLASHYCVADFNFYADENGRMILKEFGVLTYAGTQHLWIIKPPYNDSGFSELRKSRNRWKCIKGAITWEWNDGDVSYSQCLQLLKDSVKDQKVIFAYGQKKCRWLSSVLKRHVVNIQPVYKRTLIGPIYTKCESKTSWKFWDWQNHSRAWNSHKQSTHRLSCAIQKCFEYMHFLKQNEAKFGLSVSNLAYVIKSNPEKFTCYRQNCYHFFILSETLFERCDKSESIEEEIEKLIDAFSKLTLHDALITK